MTSPCKPERSASPEAPVSQSSLAIGSQHPDDPTCPLTCRIKARLSLAQRSVAPRFTRCNITRTACSPIFNASRNLHLMDHPIHFMILLFLMLCPLYTCKYLYDHIMYNVFYVYVLYLYSPFTSRTSSLTSERWGLVRVAWD